MTNLEISTRKYGDLIVVVVAGDVDLATSETLWDELRAQLVPTSALALECTGITFIDSMGVQVLMRTWQLAFERQASFSLIGANVYMMQVLRLSGLTDVFPYFADVKTAQDWLGSKTSDGQQVVRSG